MSRLLRLRHISSDHRYDEWSKITDAEMDIGRDRNQPDRTYVVNGHHEHCAMQTYIFVQFVHWYTNTQYPMSVFCMDARIVQ